MTHNPILPECESASAPLPFQNSPPLRILVVEDDAFTRHVNTKVLLRSGYHVDAVEDGAVAWDALQGNSYDLILTDNKMPNVSGVKLIEKLRAARMELPVVMATATFPTEEFARHPWLQPDATLLKPYTPDEMLRTVKKVLRETGIPFFVSQLLLDRKLKDNKTPPAGELVGTPRPGPSNSHDPILVGDENCDLRRLYADALAGPGYDVGAAEDGAFGQEALQADNQFNAGQLGREAAGRPHGPAGRHGHRKIAHARPEPDPVASASSHAVETHRDSMNKPRKTRSAKATTTPAPDATHPPQHILVVDDDPSLRQLGTEVLIRHGYQVDAAADSTTGWKMLQAHHYDLLITDLDMPKMSGLKLMKRLRAAHIALPVILASGTLTPGELNRTPWLHLSGALLKPVSTDQLLQTVQAVLGARGLIARPPNWQGESSACGWQL